MKPSLILLSLLTLSANAQSTLYTDSRTQITFQAFTDSSGYTFGLALPTTPSTDFIGTLVGRTDGWAGVSLGGSMVGKLLISAWVNGNQVITAFRKATAYAPPPTVTGMYSIHPIANGTYINATHFTINFLCKGCILTDGSTFAASDTDGYLGFALSSTPPSTPSDPKSGLQYHDNFGQFGIDLAGAQSTSYDQWANKATANSTRIGSFTSTSARFSGSARRGASGRRSAAVTSTNNLTSTSGTSNPKKLYKFRGVSGLRYE